jgi:hypothetical protein
MRKGPSASMASPSLFLQTCSLRVVTVLLPESGETGPSRPPHVFIVRPSYGVVARTVISVPSGMLSRIKERDSVRITRLVGDVCA